MGRFKFAGLSIKMFVQTKLCLKFARSYTELDSVCFFELAHGVIGNTAGFGPVVLGSSPSGPTELEIPVLLGFFYAISWGSGRSAF